MSKTAKIAIIGGAVVLLVVLLYFFGGADDDNGYMSDSWDETYDPDDRGPYGTFMLKELLDTTGMFGEFLELDKELKDALDDNAEVNDIYLFIGKKSFLNDSSTQYLLNFVRNGNTAFIAAKDFPDELIDEICFDRDMLFLEDKTIDSTQYFKFLHPNLSSKRYAFEYIYNNKKKLHTWNYFNTEKFDLDEEGDTLTSLGANTKEHTNFVRIDYGAGQLFLHSTPYTFTNISMMRRDGFQYVENILKHIPPGRVQWDKYNLKWHKTNKKKNKGGEKRRSILEFVMKNPPLLWAFIILIVGAILYAFFKGKRMQRVITATESKKNMSMKYINTLSSLYLQEKKHNKLIHLKKKTFLNFIAEHYFIQTAKPDHKFFEKVAIKSHVPQEEIEEIFATFDLLENAYGVTDEQLIELHQKIEKFYKTCR